MKTENIIFDLFGVLVSEVAPHWFRRHMDTSSVMEVKATLVGPADRGEISQVEMFTALSSRFGMPADAIEREWMELAKPDDQMIAYARLLSRSSHVGLLSNAPAPFARSLLERHGFAEIFDAVVISSEIGAAKPDPRAYGAIAGVLGCDARRAVFVDDNAVNVDGAVSAGMRGILFRSLPELRRALATMRSDEWGESP